MKLRAKVLLITAYFTCFINCAWAQEDVVTQGAVKLKNYLLLDSDGDFTGGNYYTLQDHSAGNYLRMGYGFADHLVINSIGHIGIGKTPSSPLDIATTAGSLKVDALGSASAKISSTAALGLEASSTSFIQFLSGGSELGRFTNDGKLAVGTNSVAISGTSVNTLVVGDASSSEGLIINASSSDDGIMSFASDGTLVSRFIYNNPSGSLHYYKPGLGNLFTINNSGNVGVGTNPWGKLDVVGVTYLRGAPTHTTTSEQLRIGREDLNVRYHSLYSQHTGIANTNYLQFRIHNGSGAQSTDQETVVTMLGDGNVGIGTTNPEERLSVDGTIQSEEVRVEIVNGPDYVFESDYDLKSLEEIEQFIKSEKHLPEIPPAKEMEANGVELGEMNMLLLKKIEELTLHLIDVKKENADLKRRVEKIEAKK